MYNFQDTQVFESKRYPGVRATIRALTVQRRARIDMAIAMHPDRETYLDAILEREEIVGEGRKEKVKRAALNLKLAAMERAQAMEPTLRECVESVDGLKISGVLATPETLCSGPDDLVDEIVGFINFDMRLSGVEEKNSLPLSPSSGAELVEIQSTAA